MSTLGEGGQPSFAQDVKPLFRERDRATMLSVADFDLWKHEDVVERSQSILARLADGSMPCDHPWPEDRIGLFRRWIDAGTPA